jgi:DNA-binding transcriptional LysR family regulator
MLDIAALRAFVRIAELGSLSAAARSLNSPKSSISRLLLRLEEGIGAVLVERSTRHLRLTDAGHLLLHHARRILDDVDEAENAVGGLVGIPRGILRVSVGFTFAAGPLAPILPLFLAKYPDVNLILSVNNRNIDLLREEVDVVLRIGPLLDSELIARRLATFALWPCASPAYLAQRGAPMRVADLARHTLIAHDEHNETWRFHPLTGAVELFTVVGIATIPEPAVVKVMLLAGAGIGLLPDFHATDAIAEGRLVRVLPAFHCGSVDAHALYPSHRSLSAKVRVFIDTLTEHLASKQ